MVNFHEVNFHITHFAPAFTLDVMSSAFYTSSLFEI